MSLWKALIDYDISGSETGENLVSKSKPIPLKEEVREHKYKKGTAARGKDFGSKISHNGSFRSRGHYCAVWH